MNKHIELVEKWLADNNSVSLEELKANSAAADAANDAADAAYDAANAVAADDACYADDAVAYYHANAAHYIKLYKELVK